MARIAFPNRPRLWLVALFVLAGGMAALRALPDAPPPVIAWPPPPDAARIQYVMTIAGPKDIGAGSSWLHRAASAVLGRSRQPRVMRPRAMAIYVADSARRRIFVYDRDLNRRGVLGVVNNRPVFGRPTGIAVAPNGNLWIVDTPGCTVTEMSRDGAIVRVFGRRGSGEGEFNFPTDITVGRDGRLWVLDAMNARLQEFEADGRFVRQFGRRGNGTGDFDKPKGVALDSDGHVYVADAMHDVVQVFDQDGGLLLVFGGSGTGPGQLSLPAGVHMDQGNWLYVADGLNNRVQVFRYVAETHSH
jgi:DNA-binding beta-propeller fold protein YncE